METLLVELNTFDHNHNDGDDDPFLDLESSSISLGTQEELPEAEADAEPDTCDSQSGGTINNVDEESDSDDDAESYNDIDRQPCQAGKAKRIGRQMRQLGDYNKGPHRPT